MTRPTRWAVAALLFLAPLAGLTYAAPEWVAEVGLDWWNVPKLQAEIEQRRRQSEDLNVQLRVTLSRMDEKAEITSELLAGRLTLREAVLDFRALNAANPRFIAAMRLTYPTGSEDELHVRNVLDTARARLEGDPRRDIILAGLAAELKVMTRNGQLRLEE